MSDPDPADVVVDSVDASAVSSTAGFDCFWGFAAERQRMFYRRVAGHGPPFTADPVLASHRFTNAFRASDRVSQFLIREVQRDRAWSWPDMFVRTLLFKTFNRIDTWRAVSGMVGSVDQAALLDRRVDDALAQVAARGPVYSPAYVMPPPQSFTGPKFVRHLELLRQMVADDVPARLLASPSMRDAFGVLRGYESIGDFLAYQYVTDLNYGPFLEFSETEFVVPGPGCRRGLRKCFDDAGGLSDVELLRWVWSRQACEFEQRQLPWSGLWGRPLQLIDVQNLFCEVDKYTRVALPQLSVFASGSRIKQRFAVSPEPLKMWFPPEWCLNDLIGSVDATVLAGGAVLSDPLTPASSQPGSQQMLPGF